MWDPKRRCRSNHRLSDRIQYTSGYPGCSQYSASCHYRGVTVGGKAYCKSMAIHNYVRVLMVVGRVVYFIETTLRLGPLVNSFKRRKKDRRTGKSKNEKRKPELAQRRSVDG